MRAVVAVLLLFTGCTTGPARSPALQSNPPLAADYAAHTHPIPDPWACEKTVPDPRVTEIAIERPAKNWYRVRGYSKKPTFDFGPGAAYTLTLRADGSVTYVGYAHVPHLGTRHGKISPAAFEKLKALVRDIGFESMPDRYPCLWQDGTDVSVSCVIGGKRKTIDHQQPEIAGPALLWALEAMIDRVGEDTFGR